MWTVTYRIYRQKGDDDPHFDEIVLEVNPDEYVLDGIERVWAFHDRSLTFRHACHHSTCGACGMRVNRREKLTCITRIRDVTHDGGVITVEPLRNFPVISDLAVDMTKLYAAMDAVDAAQIAAEPDTATANGAAALRLVDCIECGLCVSACPVIATAVEYIGPAALAAIQHDGLNGQHARLRLADDHDGVWRCHNAFECSAVCPSHVDPAAHIMQLRRQIIAQRFKHLFRKRPEKEQAAWHA